MLNDDAYMIFVRIIAIQIAGDLLNKGACEVNVSFIPNTALLVFKERERRNQFPGNSR